MASRRTGRKSKKRTTQRRRVSHRKNPKRQRPARRRTKSQRRSGMVARCSSCSRTIFGGAKGMKTHRKRHHKKGSGGSKRRRGSRTTRKSAKRKRRHPRVSRSVARAMQSSMRLGYYPIKAPKAYKPSEADVARHRAERAALLRARFNTQRIHALSRGGATLPLP